MKGNYKTAADRSLQQNISFPCTWFHHSLTNIQAPQPRLPMHKGDKETSQGAGPMQNTKNNETKGFTRHRRSIHALYNKQVMIRFSDWSQAHIHSQAYRLKVMDSTQV